MAFYQKLTHNTDLEAQGLYAIPILYNGTLGNINLETYLNFLTESYHIATQLEPLLSVFEQRLDPKLRHQDDNIDNIRIEKNHYAEYLLDDIRHAGGDSRQVMQSHPGLHTELMIAYSWDTVQRGNPLGLLGLLHVLDYTCLALAQKAASNIASKLELPDMAFTYMHKFTADSPAIISLCRLIDQVNDPRDQQTLCHYTKAFYLLYGNIFYNLPYQTPATDCCA